MRIAVLTSSYPRFPGDGTAPFVKSIAEHLARLGHDVHVVAPFDADVRPMENNGVEVRRFRYVWPARLHIMGHARSLDADVRLRPLAVILLPLFLLSAFFTLMWVTIKHKSQVIHVHWVIPNGLVAAWVAALRGIPFVISLHGSDIFVARRNRAFGMVARWILGRAASVTACSPDLREAALALGAQDPLLLAWGADPAVFHPTRRSPENRASFGWGQSDFVVAALGRLVHKKGFATLVEAMPTVIARYPHVRLALGGDGPLRADLARRAAQLGLEQNVSFPGRIPWDRVPDYLANADVFVLPSVRDEYGNVDGLPTVLLEAMGCGTPVIASDVGGVNLVIQDGKNGFLLTPGDAPGLANVLTSLIGDMDMQRSLGQSARRAVEGRFNWDSVARRIAELFELAVWHRVHRPRLGTAYRDEMVTLLHKRAGRGRVLDVGCHDGYLLSTLAAPVRIGVDPEAQPGNPRATLVRADGNRLPFRDGAFDFVYALDVIEHVEDDQVFAQSLARMVAPGGQLFLSTPSLNIRLMPPFLTRWVSRQWGHHYRLGYTASRLQDLFRDGLEVQASSWNGPAYRFFYLILRLFSPVRPGLMAWLARCAARWDAKHTCGEHGFQLLEAYRPASLDQNDLAGGQS